MKNFVDWKLIGVQVLFTFWMQNVHREILFCSELWCRKSWKFGKSKSTCQDGLGSAHDEYLFEWQEIRSLHGLFTIVVTFANEIIPNQNLWKYSCRNYQVPAFSCMKSEKICDTIELLCYFITLIFRVLNYTTTTR